MIEVTKRDGRKVEFDKSKIFNAVSKAVIEVDGEINQSGIDLCNKIANEIENIDIDKLSVEEIQDMVEKLLMGSNRTDVAKAYILYRNNRSIIREKKSQLMKDACELLNGDSEYWNTENSNKNPVLLSTQRDYMAGILSTAYTKSFLLDEDIVKAHNEGILHFHDSDYQAQNAISNCCLIDLGDMLQNGTCINKVKIDKPHRLLTATTIATQGITAVASSQYGGCTITLTHLAPFVRDSYNRYLDKYRQRGCQEEDCIKWAKEDTKKEITDSVQTFNYQINSMSTTNGQAPFLSVCMYLGETEEYKEELAMLIEEFLRQRIEGMKNEVGVYVTQAFPKLLYVLEEDNIREDSKYWYLTELAAKCTAKRLVPDYISEKVMKQLKVDGNGEGQCFPCMGCVEGEEIISYKYQGRLYVESFRRMWQRVSDNFPTITQPNGKDKYIDVEGRDVYIYDTTNGFVKVKKVIRNESDNWVNLKIEHGRNLICTEDHPLPTKNRGRVQAGELTKDDILTINYSQPSNSNVSFDIDKAWLLGFLLCDGCYDGHVSASIALDTEDDIQDKYIQAMKKCFNNEVEVVERHREKRGDYKDLVSKGSVTNIIDYLSCKFEGLTKNRRHIPNEVFSWNDNAKLAFLAGMIDADGYINSTSQRVSVVQIGSTNKELALQQMALAQSLGMDSKVYQNRYGRTDKLRYRVEFVPSKELISFIVSSKKKNNYIECKSQPKYSEGKVNAVEHLNTVQYSYDVETESDHFEVSGIYSHNCRSFLSPYIDEDGKPKYYGRFNQGVVTLNLVDIALSSNKDFDKFWELFEERTELCHRALRSRHDRLKGTVSDVAPILWQDGAFARLNKGEVIDKYLYGGYSTISLGYAGLYECVKYMTGHSHTDNAIGQEFGLKIMQALNNKCEQWKSAENIGYSLYGTPIENTTYKFAKCLKQRFGSDVFVKIDGHDRDYITNSYHINVAEEIDPFEKLSIESQFQALSQGGAISYIETADLTSNSHAILEVIKFIYDNIMYAELNTKSDYCQVCGYNGEIKIISENDDLIWECPNCGNRNKDKLNVARRTCGYIGSNFWSRGRTNEIQERYVHLDDKEVE